MGNVCGPRVDRERADEDVAADVLAEEIDHRLEVGALIAGGVEDDVEVARAAREDAAYAVVVAAVGLEPLDSGGQVGLAPASIEDRHLMTRRVQRAQQSQSDEAGAAEEERSHVPASFLIDDSSKTPLDRPFYSRIGRRGTVSSRR